MNVISAKPVSNKNLQAETSSNTFKNHLISVGNFLAEGVLNLAYILYDSCTDFYHSTLSEESINHQHYGFASELIAATSLKRPSKNANSSIEMRNANSLKANDAARVNSRTAFITDLEKIRAGIKHDAEAAKKIQAVIAYLGKAAGDLDVVENAYISTVLEAVLLDLEKESAAHRSKAEHYHSSYKRFQTFEISSHIAQQKDQAENAYKISQYLISLVKPLERQAFLGWNHLANEKKIDALDDDYRTQFKVGYTRSITIDGSLGASVGLPGYIPNAELELGASVTGAYNVLWMLDDEGYIAIIKTTAVGLEAHAKVDVLNKVGASAVIEGARKQGTYYEVKTSREFVTYLLPDFIRDTKHRNDPRITPYLSRSATLAHAMPDKKLSRSFTLEAITSRESNGIDQRKRKYDLLKDHNDKLRSLPAPSGTFPSVSDSKKDEDTLRLQAFSWIEEQVEIQGNYTIDELKEKLDDSPELSSIEKVVLRYIDDYKDHKPSKKAIPSSDIKISSVKPCTAQLTGYEGIFTGDVSEGDEKLLAVGGSVSVGYKHRLLRDNKPTSFCATIKDPITEHDAIELKQLIAKLKNSSTGIDEIKTSIKRYVKSPEEVDGLTHEELIRVAKQLLKKVEVRREIETQFDSFKNILSTHWKKELEQAPLTPTGREVQQKSSNKKVSYQDFESYLEGKLLSKELLNLHWDAENHVDLLYPGHELKEMFSDKSISYQKFAKYLDDNSIAKWLLSFHWDAQNQETRPTKWELLKEFDLVTISRKVDVSDGHVMFERLQYDFDSFTNIHVRMEANNYKPLPGEKGPNEKCLDGIAERYGINLTDKNVQEQLLHRMLIANAYLFSKTTDKNLQEQMSAFEQSLLTTKSEIDCAYLDAHAYFRSDINFESTEIFGSAGFSFTVVSAGITFKADVTHRVRTHTNPLRDGSYWDLTFFRSGELTDIKAFMNSAAEAITKNYPAELATQILKDMESVLSQGENTGMIGREYAYLSRYFKPKALKGGKLGYRKLFNRITFDKQFHTGIKGTIPTPLPAVNVTASLGYSHTTTDSESENFSADTFLYALMFAMHEYTITTEDKSKFDLSKNEQWISTKQEQKKYFKKAFKQYAKEVAKGGKAEHGSLSADIEAIHEGIKKSLHLSKEQKEAFDKAKQEFQIAVKRFSLTSHKQAPYNEALSKFENLTKAYYPAWEDQRANAPHWQEGYLPQLEKSPSVQERRQHDKLTSLLREENYYSPEVPSFANYHSADLPYVA